MMARRYRILAIVAPIAVILDQITKAWVRHYFHWEEGGSVQVIPGFFNLVYSRNPGAAWRVLGNLQPDALRIAVFVAISIAAVAVVITLARRARDDQWVRVGALALILAGAIGNLIDRLVAGRVTDFLEVYSRAGWMVGLLHCDKIYGCVWPAFNVADSCISVGVTILLVEGLLADRRGKIPAAS
jgi:signal peptidase II